MNEEPRPTGTTISDELNRLGRQLADAARLAWESEDRKRLQSEIVEGVRRFGDQLDTTMQQVGENDTTRQITEQAQKMVNNVRETRVVDEVRDGLITGLASLNRELSRLVDRLAERTAAAPAQPAVAEPWAPQYAPPAAPADDVPPAPPADPGI